MSERVLALAVPGCDRQRSVTSPGDADGPPRYDREERELERRYPVTLENSVGAAWRLRQWCWHCQGQILHDQLRCDRCHLCPRLPCGRCLMSCHHQKEPSRAVHTLPKFSLGEIAAKVVHGGHGLVLLVADQSAYRLLGPLPCQWGVSSATPCGEVDAPRPIAVGVVLKMSLADALQAVGHQARYDCSPRAQCQVHGQHYQHHLQRHRCWDYQLKPPRWSRGETPTMAASRVCRFVATQHRWLVQQTASEARFPCHLVQEW